jgi:hypothetical protein
LVPVGVTIDISEVAQELAILHGGRKARARVAIVVPLAEGRCDVVREFLSEGPPFDPAAVGVLRHDVFLTEREAIFVFETESGTEALERILAEPELWDVAGAWERCLAEKPRIATGVYEWPEHRSTARAT